jgi:biotin carboxyl carrier protein
VTFEIEVNGRARSVAVERAGADGRFRVTIDGETTLVDAQRFGDFGISLLFPDGSHESGTVHIAPAAARGEWLAVVDGRTASVVVNGRRSRHAGDGAGAGDGEQRIVAPMPGRVVRVLVAPGDEVEARQPVVVVEAMKMENELRAARAGRVREVAAAAGTSVDAGRVLVVIE